MTSLKKLRELCLAATSGEWTATVSFTLNENNFPTYIAQSSAVHVYQDRAANDAKFIAAMNPQTILNLLDEVEAARAVRDNRTTVRDYTTYDQIRKQNEGEK